MAVERELSSTDPAEISGPLWAGFNHYRCGFDIGANCGQSIPQMLACCEYVISCEPNGDSYAVLEHRWWGDERVRTLQVAVSGHEGSIMLAALPGRQAETGQLVTPGTTGMEWDPGDWEHVPLQACVSRTVDGLAGDYGLPGLIKVDTEGHEALVLAGAAQVLGNAATDWLIEFHSAATYAGCMERLARAGYSPETIRHPHYPVGTPMWHTHGWIRALGDPVTERSLSWPRPGTQRPS